MARKHLIIGSVVTLLATLTCLSAAMKKNGKEPAKLHLPQYNICLLLDLSDRISPTSEPLQRTKDRQAIAGILELFEEQVKSRLFVNSTDVIRVGVADQPTGYGETLLRITDVMTIDMGRLKATKKREQFPRLKEQFLARVDELYQVACANTAFEGADIWRFFREDLDKYRVSETAGRPIRNILVVLTDGYITFGNQKTRPRKDNRASFMNVARFRHNGWEQEFVSGNHGLMSGGKHPEWEVLVLEVSPKRTEDLPIITKYWSQWFEEMGINRYRIEKSNDSARMSKQVTADFLSAGNRSKVTTRIAKINGKE